MKLTNEDKELLRSCGYSDRDIQQIEEAASKSKTTYTLEDREISRDKVIELLGRREYLSGLARSAFHWTAARCTVDGRSILFDSSALFRGI